jgi:hypothetical protein
LYLADLSIMTDSQYYDAFRDMRKIFQTTSSISKIQLDSCIDNLRNIYLSLLPEFNLPLEIM